MSQENYYKKFKGTKDNKSNINVTFDTIFRAETLKKTQVSAQALACINQ